LNKRVYACLMTAALAAAFCGCSYKSAAGQPASADAGLLMDEAESAMAGDWRLTARHAGDFRPYRDDRELRTQGAETAGKLGLEPSGGMDRAGGVPVFRADGVIPGTGRVTLTMAGTKDGRPDYLVVKLEAEGAAARKAAVEWMEQTGKILDELGSKADWNVMAQGALNPAFAGENPPPEAVMGKLALDLGAKPAEQYTDAGTSSVSFTSDRFAVYVRSGRNRIAFQAALHRVTESGEWRLTLGAPLITSEY
jgi:hypothetical protein